MKNRETGKGHSGREKLGSAIVNAILKVQKSWAQWMGRSFNRLNRRMQFSILVIVLVTGSCYCLLLIVAPLKTPGAMAGDTGAITVPYLQGNEALSALDSGQYLNDVRDFFRYRDSIQSVGGMPWREFNRKYGGLADTLMLLHGIREK